MTNSESLSEITIELNNCLPNAPPTIELSAMIRLSFTLILIEFRDEIINETVAIEKTVTADKIPIVDTSYCPIKSRTGLIIMPPPSPASDPNIVAPRPIRK